MKSSKHAVIGILSIIAGLLVSFVLAPLYGSVMEKKDKVPRLKSNIEAGQLIDDSVLEEAEVGVYNISDKIVKNKDEIVGKYANSALYSGSYLTKDMLSATPLKSDLYLSSIPEDKYAISVTVHSFAAGLSSKLLRGDIVSVLIRQENEDGETVCVVPDELMYVEVLSSTEDSGKDKQSNVAKNSKDKKEETEKLATVTLLVNKEQAAVLALYEPDSKIHIALKSRGNDKETAKLLKIQEDFFASEAVEENIENVEDDAEEIEASGATSEKKENTKAVNDKKEGEKNDN